MDAKKEQPVTRYISYYPHSHYSVDSIYIKTAFGREDPGRNPVDRRRKAIKVSALTNQDGIVHIILSDPANTSDFRVFTPMLSSMLIELRRIDVFTDRGYVSRPNRTEAPRSMQ